MTKRLSPWNCLIFSVRLYVLNNKPNCSNGVLPLGWTYFHVFEVSKAYWSLPQQWLLQYWTCQSLLITVFMLGLLWFRRTHCRTVVKKIYFSSLENFVVVCKIMFFIRLLIFRPTQCGLIMFWALSNLQRVWSSTVVTTDGMKIGFFQSCNSDNKSTLIYDFFF